MMPVLPWGLFGVLQDEILNLCLSFIISLCHVRVRPFILVPLAYRSLFLFLLNCLFLYESHQGFTVVVGFCRTLLTFAPTSVGSVFNFFGWVSFKSIGVSEEGISSYFLIKYEMCVFTLPFTNSGSKLQFLVLYGCCGFFDIKKFNVWKFN